MDGFWWPQLLTLTDLAGSSLPWVVGVAQARVELFMAAMLLLVVAVAVGRGAGSVWWASDSLAVLLLLSAFLLVAGLPRSA